MFLLLKLRPCKPKVRAKKSSAQDKLIRKHGLIDPRTAELPRRVVVRRKLLEPPQLLPVELLYVSEFQQSPRLSGAFDNDYYLHTSREAGRRANRPE